MVLLDSRRVPRVPRYSGTSFSKINKFNLQDYHLLWFRFPADSTIYWFFDLPRKLQFPPTKPHNTKHTTLAGLHIFGLGWSHFARRYFENRVCFLFLRVLRCFSSPRLPLLPMYSVINFTELPVMGFPIQKSPDQSLLAAPRSFSQLTTSFIASLCLGIHRTPFVAWP